MVLDKVHYSTMLKITRIVLVWLITAPIGLMASSAEAVCSFAPLKRVRLESTSPDIYFPAGVTSSTSVDIDYRFGAGEPPLIGGTGRMFARSLVPGITIERGYGMRGVSSDFEPIGAPPAGTSLKTATLAVRSDGTTGWGTIELRMEQRDTHACGAGAVAVHETYLVGHVNVFVGVSDSANFQVTTAAATTSVEVDYPLLNHNPSAKPIVTLTSVSSPGSTSTVGNLFIRWNDITKKWIIHDQSGSAFPAGTTFSVLSAWDTPQTVRVVSDSANTVGDSLTLSHSILNDNPDAVPVFLPVRNSLISDTQVGVTPFEAAWVDRLSGTIQDEAVTLGRWRIRTVDGSDLPLGTVFHVLVLGGADSDGHSGTGFIREDVDADFFYESPIVRSVPAGAGPGVASRTWKAGAFDVDFELLDAIGIGVLNPLIIVDDATDWSGEFGGPVVNSTLMQVSWYFPRADVWATPSP